jgi:hypothetical protein
MRTSDLARELAESPLLPQLLEELKADYIKTWEAASDIKQREHQWRLVKALEDLREHVDTRIRDLAGDG